jgi:5'-nucleotidase
VTYGEIFQVQPFGNVLHTVTLTGTQLLEALEEQFRGSRTRLLQVSSTLSYTYTRSGPPYVDPASVRIGGAALDPKRAYRVTVSDFIFNGGDGFRAFGKGTDLTVGPSDVEALEGYFASFGAGVVPVTSPHGRRITFARGSPSP